MPEPLPPGTGREASRGFTAEVMHLFASLGGHVQALVALAGLESREAASVYVRALLALAAGLVFLLFGYLLLLLFVAFVLAWVFAVDWIWISLGLAVLHFLGVAGCALYLKSRLKTPLFVSTTAELQRDLDALRNFKP
jgi:uncharacterized membrane protein YqjE